MENNRQQEIPINAQQHQALLQADLRIEGIIAKIGQQYTMICKDKESIQAVCVNRFDYGNDSKTSVFLSVDCYNRLKQQQTFQERINALRKELIQSIVDILKYNGLQRLDFSENLEDPTYVLWNEPQEGLFYDSPVLSIAIYKDGISIDVEDSETEFADTLYSCYGELACMHLDWLNGLRENVLTTLHDLNLQNNRNAIELTILDNGDLEIAVSNREEFQDIINKKIHDERAYLADLMENSRYIGNDWWCACNIGLTESPAIGQGAIFPEDENYDGEPADYENLWYFPDYAIKSYLEILQTEGKIVFTGHPDNISKKQ